MVDTAACSPCNFEALLALPSPGNELLSLGLPSIASPHVPHAAGQVQPAQGQRTPDAASLNFVISDEEMQWLVALTDEDGITLDAGASAAATAAPAAAAQALATSAAVAAAPLPQQDHPMQLLDQRLLHIAASMPDLSSASAASAAADVLNNACWAVDLGPRHALAAGSAALTAPLLEDQVLLQELRLWNSEHSTQSAPCADEPHTPTSSGQNRPLRGGKPLRRPPQPGVRKRGRRPALKSAFQRDIELFTQRVKEEEAEVAQRQAAQPSQQQQQQQQQLQPAPGTCTPAQQVGVSSGNAAVVAQQQSLTAMLMECLDHIGRQSVLLQPGTASAAGQPSFGAAITVADGVLQCSRTQATDATEVPVQVVDYQLKDWRQQTQL